MTDKQKIFVQEYCANGLNATQAYKAAYPNCKGGHNRLGHRLMTNDDIRQAIDAKLAERRAETGYDRQQAEAKLGAAYDMAKVLEHPGEMVQACRALNKLFGLEMAEQAVPDQGSREFSAEELAELKAMAERLTKVKAVSSSVHYVNNDNITLTDKAAG